MKKRMKRFLALGIGILMIGVSACGSRTPADTQKEQKQEQTAGEQEQQVGKDQTDNTQNTQETEDPEPSENSEKESEQSADVNDQTFEKMTQALSQYEEGTAGASLKRLQAAFGLLNFSEQYDSTQKDDFRTKLQAWLEEQGEGSKDALRLKLEELDPVVDRVFSEGISTMKEELSDAGNPQKYDTYSQEKYHEVMEVIEDVINS